MHFIDKNGRRQFAVASTFPLESAHKADYLANAIQTEMTQLEIGVPEIVLIVRDAAAVMKKTMSILNVPSWDCFNHKMHLVLFFVTFYYYDSILQAVTDCLKIERVNDVIVSVRSIVSYFNKSDTFQRRFYEVQTENGMSRRSLIQDIRTRWNSCYYMLQRVIDQKRVLVLLSLEQAGTQIGALNFNDVEV